MNFDQHYIAEKQQLCNAFFSYISLKRNADDKRFWPALVNNIKLCWYLFAILE